MSVMKQNAEKLLRIEEKENHVFFANRKQTNKQTNKQIAFQVFY
jgi:hypothetical protein